MSPGADDELCERICKVALSKEKAFRELIRVGGISPAGKDWSGLPFLGEDLRGLDFSYSRLVECTFADALIEGCRFTGAQIGDAGNRVHSLAFPDLAKAADWGSYLSGWQRTDQKETGRLASLVPGTVFIDAPFAPWMVVVPPLPQGSLFAIGIFQATFNNWDECPGRLPHVDDGAWGRGSRPVVNVAFHEVQKYLAALNRLTGLPYRLPTSEEWLHCARAGSTTAYCFGDTITRQDANYDYQAPLDRQKVGRAEQIGGDQIEITYADDTSRIFDVTRCRTEMVERYMPNQWGLHQVHGNVWEMCDYDASSNSLIVHGGSWLSDATELAFPTKETLDSDLHTSRDLGFRVALDLS